MKITLPIITNGQDLSTLNSNFAAIMSALNNQVLYRTNPIGELNTINQDIDYNGFKAYNLSDVLVNGVSISQEATIAQAAATQAAASASTAITQAASASGSATAAASSAASAAAVVGTSLLKANNLSDLQSITIAKTNLSLVKSDVGLGNVDNTSDINKPVSTAQAAADALKAPIASPTFTGTVGGITATMVGLGNVTNTSDANKPVSTAQATAIALKLNHAGDVTGGNAAAGDIGEYITGTTSGTSLVNGTPYNAASISLTAGDWDVSGTISFIGGAGANSSVMNASISTTSATQNSAIGFMASSPNATAAAVTVRLPTPTVRISITSTTTVYLVGVDAFSGGTVTSDGLIRARRIR